MDNVKLAFEQFAEDTGLADTTKLKGDYKYTQVKTWFEFFKAGYLAATATEQPSVNKQGGSNG